MNRFNIVAAVVIFAGAAILWSVQYENQVRLREENESLQRKLERMVQLEKANERLANRLEQVDSRFSDEELRELLKLRNEVSMLRRQTNELIELREQNERLRLAAGARIESPSPVTNAPSGEMPLAIYPKASWAFAGFATPEDAFLSLNWAASNGDVQTLLANCTPDMQQEFARQFANRSESDIAEEIQGHINKNTEVRILKKEVVSDGEVVLTIQGVGEERNSAEKLAFRRLDGQWKLASDH
jgi:hypothetical protein